MDPNSLIQPALWAAAVIVLLALLKLSNTFC